MIHSKLMTIHCKHYSRKLDYVGPKPIEETGDEGNVELEESEEESEESEEDEDIFEEEEESNDANFVF
ncbi:hypothetical protein JH06_0653 [Blastocystis sp. subtype 4]|uniref:hypothetical protein n=1 Tax=Blastocystis sp. subtype 4 TaxID=944170 RepID=UPI000711EDEB|nr:hypothetical protein JH06_0653 [Blastocystis sp. subtype 4]KNB45724.1 hypothetical protein JH06_0653 [Blastocystis sp. subtype 4]|eukprot:XP_014529167.1 hypothetical protein JH06_0653 [Blastocystis sp. subtype 4]